MLICCIFYRAYGLADLCGLDLEINLSLDPSEAKRILDCIVEKVANGKELSNFLITSELTGAPVYVRKYKSRHPKHDNEECYRIAFSDENYKLPMDEECGLLYKNQLEK